jgi:hypothetical protein
MVEFEEMQKNPGENFTVVEVDPVTGEYYIRMEIDGDSILITEIKGD